MGEILGGAGLGIIGNYMQNQANSAMVNQQESYQTSMSDTAYQRQTQDMKAAGLNPMFAIGSGGASSPAGSVAQQGNPVSAGIQGAQQAQQFMNAKATQENANRNTAADINLKAAQTLQSAAQTKNLGLDSKEKEAVANVADGVNSVVNKVKQGYSGLRGLFQGTAQKGPISYGTPEQEKFNYKKSSGYSDNPDLP